MPAVVEAALQRAPVDYARGMMDCMRELEARQDELNERLAAVPADRADQCATALAAAGCGGAVIGGFRTASPGGRVRLRT